MLRSLLRRRGRRLRPSLSSLFRPVDVSLCPHRHAALIGRIKQRQHQLQLPKVSIEQRRSFSWTGLQVPRGRLPGQPADCLAKFATDVTNCFGRQPIDVSHDLPKLLLTGFWISGLIEQLLLQHDCFGG
ncbi:MAG: hypothetical protein EBZ13_12235 [Planctomycetia bacterium]|nr:hypothetical protein [Planctomycetia bacterium]